MEKFLDADPIFAYRNRTDDAKGYYLTLDSNLFTKSEVKWEGSLLLSSLEFKNRIMTKCVFSAISVNKDSIDRSSDLLKNWDSPVQWTNEGLSLNEDGKAVLHSEGVLLKDSISKEDLRDELLISNSALKLSNAALQKSIIALKAQNTEIRWKLRKNVLAYGDEANQELRNMLKFSRFSVPSLFGPVPIDLLHKITNNPTQFPRIKLNSVLGSKGGLKTRSNPTLSRPTVGRAGFFTGSRGGARSTRARRSGTTARNYTPKNGTRGGGAQAQPPRRGVGRRGARGGRGRGREEKTKVGQT